MSDVGWICLTVILVAMMAMIATVFVAIARTEP